MPAAQSSARAPRTLRSAKKPGESPAALLASGLEFYERSALEPALETLIRAARAAQSEAAWSLQAQACVAQGKVYRDLGEPQRALECLDAALELARSQGDPVIEGDALNQRAGVHHLMGEYARALKDLSQALLIARAFQDERRAANCLMNIGILNTKLADFPRALSALSESHALVRERLQDSNIEGQCLVNLSLLYESMGDNFKALEMCQLALETVSGLGNLVLEAITTVNLGYAHKRLGQFEVAAEHFERALALAVQIGHAKVEIAALDGLGQVRSGLGAALEALELHLAALQRARDTGDLESEMDALVNIARAYLLDQANERAIEPLLNALHHAEQAGRQRTIFEAHELLAETYERLGDSQRALQHFRAYHLVEKQVFNEEREHKTRQLSIQFDLERAQHETEVYRLRTELEREAKERAEAMVQRRTLELERGHQIIERQRAELQEKVEHLGLLLEQNEALRQRLVLAATRSTAINERFLRRLSAELHDGPAQELGFVLLKLDGAAFSPTSQSASELPRERYSKELETIQLALGRALAEMRAIAAGMCLPELEQLSLFETLRRAVQAHKRRTQTEVDVQFMGFDDTAPLPIKITMYRLAQESLANAFKHGGGRGQAVRLIASAEDLRLEISDRGPGFDLPLALERNERLGLVGMRERVESLGGAFQVRTAPGQGTQVSVRLPLHSALARGDEDA